MTRRILRYFLNFLGLGAVLVLVASALGALHPVGDSLAVFRTWLAMGGLALAVVIRLAASARLGAVLAAISVGLGVPVALLSLLPMSQSANGDLTLYQKNLNFGLTTPADVVADIEAVSPDIVTLQEVTDANAEAVLDALPAAYTSVRCPFSRGVGGLAVASRLPIIEGSRICEDGSGWMAVQVDGRDGPIWIVSIHLHWPFPYDQSQQVDAMVPGLAGLEGPVVVAGDFNMVPWSHAIGQITHATGTRVLGPVRGTRYVVHPLIDLPIDHVLAPGTGSVSYRPRLGSDHEGVVARIVF